MAGVAELNSALQAAGYASRALQIAKLGSTLYNAATTAGSAAASAGAATGAGTAGVTIAPMTGIGTITTMAALWSMMAGLIDSAEEKNTLKNWKDRVKHMKEAGGVVEQATSNPPKNAQDFRKFLDTSSYKGAKLGDVFMDMVHKNLTGELSGQQGSGHQHGLTWVPDEKLAPLAAGLTQMGYAPGRVQTSGLLTYSGGPGQHERRTLRYADTEKSLENWGKILSQYASVFPKGGTYGPTKPREAVLEQYKGMYAPTVEDLAAFVKRGQAQDPYLPKVIPSLVNEIQQKYYPSADLDAAWNRYQDTNLMLPHQTNDPSLSSGSA